MSIYQDALRERLKLIRESLNYSKSKFSEMIGMTIQHYTDLERGRRGISVDMLATICEKGNISADYLLFGRSGSDGWEATPLGIALREAPNEYRVAVENMALNYINDLTKVHTGSSIH